MNNENTDSVPIASSVSMKSKTDLSLKSISEEDLHLDI